MLPRHEGTIAASLLIESMFYIMPIVIVSSLCLLIHPLCTHKASALFCVSSP